MSRAELKQGLKRKYERLKRKAVNCDNSSTELLEKQKKSTGSIKNYVIKTEVARKLIKAMHKPLFFRL